MATRRTAPPRPTAPAEEPAGELATAAPLDVHQDPPPGPTGPVVDLPPPDIAPPGPEGGEEVEQLGGDQADGTVQVDAGELAAMAGGLWAELNGVLAARLFPEQPLTEEEKAALSRACGPLIAHYLPETLDRVHILWATAVGGMVAVYLPRVQAKLAARMERDPHTVTASPENSPPAPTGPAATP